MMPIIVNKVEITDDEVHGEMQYHPAANIEEARHKAAQALVIRQLLVQEAVNLNLLDLEKNLSTKATDTAIDALLKQKISVPEANKESCERYYQQNQERFKDQKTGELLPLENVENHIRDYLHARSLQTGISQYIKVLFGKARIAGFDSNSPIKLNPQYNIS